MLYGSSSTRNLVFFLLGLLISFLFLVPYYSFADDCNFSSYDNFSEELADLVENSTPSSTGSWHYNSSLDCRLGPPYYEYGGGNIINVYDYNPTYAGWCDANPTATYTSSIVGRWRSMYFDNGCVLPIPPIPDTWSNGIKDSDEDGRDCGGVTGVACVDTCWPESNLVNGLCETVRTIAPNASGDCPSDYFPMVEGGTVLYCDEIIAPYSPFLASADWTAPEGESSTVPPAPSNPWNEETTNTDTTIAASTVTDADGTEHEITTVATVKTDTEGNSETVQKTVDVATAPDNSKTVTTTTTTMTNGSGSSDSVTSTVTNVQTFDASGALVGESEVATTTEADPEKDADNPAGAPSSDDFLKDANDIDFGPLVSTMEVAAGKWPFNVPNTMVGFYEMLDVEPAAPSFTLRLLGRDLVVDLSIFDTLASVLRFLVGTLITLGLFYYIVHFYRGVS